MYKKVGMEYQKTVYKLGPKQFCKYFNDDKFFYPDMVVVSDFPPQGTCPWPAVRLNNIINYFIIIMKMSLIENLSSSWIRS